MTISISRKPQLVRKVIMTGGLDGCGKTLFTPIIASLSSAELSTYSYEIEHYCALYFLGKIDLDTASSLIRMQTDYKLYNTMMGREVNFRADDLSSVFNYHNPIMYLRRLFEDGDSVIPDLVNRKSPVLNLIIHNVLFASAPIWRALGDKCVYIEIVRHPLYMVRQQCMNMNNLINDVRDFIIYYSKNDKHYPYWVRGWENVFDASSDMERSVHYIDQMTRRTSMEKETLIGKYKANILTIPFERFVLDPSPWIDKISEATGLSVTEATTKVMNEQNIPRDMVAQGIDIDVYRRYGWVPPREDTTERDELNIRRDDVSRGVDVSTLAILDRLSVEYERKYWDPEDYRCPD